MVNNHSNQAHAELTIEITRGADDALPIAVVPFAGTPAPLQDNIGSIIHADLERSGRFKPLPAAQFPTQPHSGGEVLYTEWKASSAQYIVVGSVKPAANGAYEIRYELFSTTQQMRLLGEVITVSAEKWRTGAHHISDKIFEKITNARGVFSTRIIYVNQYTQNNAPRYRLELSDADGQRPTTILDSSQPILSPTWSPDGSRVAYVSFEDKLPAIYVQHIGNRTRTKLTRFPGLNGAPAWSPDGKTLALTLSRDGNPEIYLMDLATQALTRLTNSLGIDTEPRWMPDGRALVFTSDRGGSAQIYRLNIADKSTQRLTFSGNFNARADVSADGRTLAFVHREKGQQFEIAVQDLDSGLMTSLSQTRLNESPSFAPNGISLVYATRRGKYGELAITSLDGRFQAMLPSKLGAVREPAWSPFLN